MTEETLVRSGNPVEVTVRDRHGRIKQVIQTTNLRTTAGANFQKNQMSGTAVAVANYIAVSNDGVAPVIGDTVVAGEQTTNGLARAVGTFDGSPANAYTLTKTFTYTGGSPITLTKAGMLNAASAGTLVFEALFGSSATLVNGDQITVQWTVNIEESEVPTEKLRTKAGVTATVNTPAETTTELDADQMCDLDGSRLEVYGRTSVGETTYEVRKCSSNPNHIKQIPL